MAGCDGKGVLVDYNLPPGDPAMCPKCGGILKYDPNPAGQAKFYCDCEQVKLWP